MAKNPYDAFVSDEKGNPYEAFAKPPKKVLLGPEGRQQALREVLEEEASPFAAKAISGAGTALDQAAYRLKQLMGGELTPQEVARVEGNRDLLAAGGFPATAGNIAGNIAMVGGPAASLYRGAAGLAGRALPAWAAPSAGAATVGGTLGGLTEPVLEGESTAGHVGLGMAGGLLGDAAVRGGARLLQPIIQSPAVQALLRHNVVPTPGQAAGPSFLQRLEERMQSIPGIGDIITGARRRGAAEFRNAAINQAVPGAGRIRGGGAEAIDELAGLTTQNYERMLAGRNVRPDEDLARAINAARESTLLPLSESGRRKFDEVINKHLWQRTPLQPVPGSERTGTALVPAGQTGFSEGGSRGFSSPIISADAMKRDVIGDIGKSAQEYLRSASAEERAIGQALRAARDATQSWMLRAAGIPGREMATADAAYVAKKAVEDASEGARAMARGGEFTPLELLRNARPGSATERLAQAGQAVLPGTVPNSGTADRLLTASLLGLGAGGVGINEYYGGPGYLSALFASPLLYSRTGSRYLLGDLIPGQAAGAQALRGLAPYGAQAGGLLMP